LFSQFFTFALIGLVVTYSLNHRLTLRSLQTHPSEGFSDFQSAVHRGCPTSRLTSKFPRVLLDSMIRIWGPLHPACCHVFFLWLIAFSSGVESAELRVGLVKHPTAGVLFADEWAWALRGGGAEMKMLSHRDLSALSPEIPLLIIDSAPLNEAARRALEHWVSQGGLLIYAGAEAALQKMNDQGGIQKNRELISPELLGASFAGFDPGLIGVYPDIAVSSPLLSPLREGDALRFGAEGVGQTVQVEATDGEVLARGARLSPGPNGIVFKSNTPTILSKRYGQGRVVFLTFSPARIALCYRENWEPRDCGGAGQAHALMRWLAANLLWEERKLQLPLLWEAPGDRPHAVIVTGDVHRSLQQAQDANQMGKIFNDLKLPLSLYVVGRVATATRTEFHALQKLNDLEISPHSASGKDYAVKKFRYTRALGILADLRKAESLLAIPDYPSKRGWLISMRNEAWSSDRGAWWAMEHEGIGLVFDHVADSTQSRLTHLAPRIWFDGGEQQRLFVPIFERSVTSRIDNFRLRGDSERNIASLSSAQPEPCCKPLDYPAYTRYVERWHALFDRLAPVGGLTEVWLWHPTGVAMKAGFDDMEKTLRQMSSEPTVSFLRGDVVATWRFNRELYRIRAERDPRGAILSMDLMPPAEPSKPLPPGAPAFASSTSYWVLGSLTVPGWATRNWTDPMGRPITVLVHPLH